MIKSVRLLPVSLPSDSVVDRVGQGTLFVLRFCKIQNSVVTKFGLNAVYANFRFYKNEIHIE